MATSIPPWLDVRPRDFVRAGSEGAQAGLEAARTRQQGQESEARIGLESQRLAMQAQEESQRASESEARLSQAERIANMEMQARKDIAEKNALRSQQQIAIQSAYHSAQLGLGQQRINQQKDLADLKMREAAMTFADEQGFAREIASGTPVPQALFKYPRTKSSIVGVLGAHAAKDYGEIETVDLPGGAVAALRRGSPGFKMINTRQSEEVKIQDHTLKMRQDSLEKSAAKLDVGDPERASLERRIKDIEAARIALTKQRATTNSPFKEGQRVRHKDGTVHVIQNGEPVPVDEGDQTDEDQ